MEVTSPKRGKFSGAEGEEEEVRTLPLSPQGENIKQDPPLQRKLVDANMFGWLNHAYTNGHKAARERCVELSFIWMELCLERGIHPIFEDLVCDTIVVKYMSVPEHILEKQPAGDIYDLVLHRVEQAAIQWGYEVKVAFAYSDELKRVVELRDYTLLSEEASDYFLVS